MKQRFKKKSRARRIITAQPYRLATRDDLATVIEHISEAITAREEFEKI